MNFRINNYRFLLVGIFFLLASFAFGHIRAAVNPLISEADSLYDKGEYSKAADAYLKVAKKDGTSPALLFNMGNAYAQSGDFGRAMLYFARAQRLDPANKEINNNLNYLSSKVEDSNRAELRGKKISVGPDPETFFDSAYRILAKEISSNTWAFWSVATFLLFLGGVALYLFCSNVMIRKTGFFGGICLFLISIFCIVCSFMGASASDTHDEAILLAYKTSLLTEPSSDAKPSSQQICQGSRLLIMAEEDDSDGNPIWYKVRLNSSIDGWIHASDVEII